MTNRVSDRASPAVRALFSRHGPIWQRAFTVLDGTAVGRVLTDDATAPTWAAVHEHSDDPALFLVGALTRELVADLIADLRRERNVVVSVTPDDPLLSLLPPDPDYDGGAIDFDYRTPEVDLEPFIVPPDGLHLARVDLQLLPRLEWGAWAASSDEAALEHGLGFCLLDGEQVVAEAFAGPITGGLLEMGTITHEDYRRRGLARIVCARTILEAERMGHHTWWNVDDENIPSIHLARALGYRSEHRYRVLAWLSSEGDADTDATPTEPD